MMLIDFVLLLCFVQLVTSNGICNETIRQTLTRSVSYQQSYKKKVSIWRKKKTLWRTAYRVESYNSYQQHDVCCIGYTRIPGPNMTCSPVCTTACQNGFCSSPEVCTCNFGYKLNPSNKYNCFPICSHGCQYGTCSAPETCTCNPGYQNQGDNKYICKPVCSKSCINGDCIFPEVCSFKAGYQLSVDARPIPARICVKPDVCSYFDNLVYSNVTGDCEIPCREDCINGNCQNGTCSCDVEERCVMKARILHKAVNRFGNYHVALTSVIATLILFLGFLLGFRYYIKRQKQRADSPGNPRESGKQLRDVD